MRCTCRPLRVIIALNVAAIGRTDEPVGGFKGRHPGPVTAEVWKYDSASDTWTTGPPLPEPRAGGGLEIVERKLHYFGGYKADRNTDSGDHWSLSLAGGITWKREADLPDPRGHVSATALDGKIYALGGDHGHDITQIDVDSCHRFDPATNKWHVAATHADKGADGGKHATKLVGAFPSQRECSDPARTAAARATVVRIL